MTRPHRPRLAVRWVHAVLALALALCFGARARADEPVPSGTAGSLLASSSVGSAPDLATFQGRPVTRVETVLDDTTWDDIAAPAITAVPAGTAFSQAVARQALAEGLKSGLFGRGRVSVLADGAGVKLLVHLMPRKVIKAVHLDFHGGRVDRDEVETAAGLTAGGELIAHDLPEARTRTEAVFRQHGYPQAAVTFRLREMDDPGRSSS